MMSSAMDIDDILATVDRDNFTSPESTALDHQQLTRLWVAERAVSQLLPWPGQLMERMMERVRKQVRLYFERRTPLVVVVLKTCFFSDEIGS
jgi:hypothetical protein